MDAQIAPPPTVTQRLTNLADLMRAAMSRAATFGTRAAHDESRRAQRDFFKVVDEVLSTAAPATAAPPRTPRQVAPAFIVLPQIVRDGAAEASARALRNVIGEGSQAEHYAIAAAVWNFMRTYNQEGTNA